jgi:dolichyl-phosphate beta-glucosyltransferase
MTQNTNKRYLSLIIPTYNEAARIGKSLDKILRFLDSQPYTFEVIIVDDGSRDRTVELIKEYFGGRPNLRLHLQPANLGKGKAVQQGMLLGNGDYLFFSDADLSVPIEMLPIFLTHLENQADLAIGTRQKAGAVIEIHQSYHRELMGKIYTALSNWILGVGFTDFTCGFKGFRREVARDLFSRQRLGNWSFDAEILYLAQHKGYCIAEIPVRWRNDNATKVRLRKDVLTSFLGLFQIRLYDFQGKYR